MQLNSSPRPIILLVSTVALLVGGCTGGSPPESESEDTDDRLSAGEPGAEVDHPPMLCANCHTDSDRSASDAIANLRARPDQWQKEIACGDSQVRAAAASMVPANPGDDGAALLESLATLDPAPAVRERAVLSYGSMLGRDASPLLKTIALTDADANVAQAAIAELDRIREESPEPPRGFIDVVYPDHIEVNEPFDIRVKFGSAEDVPEVHLGMTLPRGLRPAERALPRWRGELHAGQTREVVFTVRADSNVHTSARVRLKLDYPEMLDVEVLKKDVQISTDDSTGTLVEPAAAP